jgi:hypothetical protein
VDGHKNILGHLCGHHIVPLKKEGKILHQKEKKNVGTCLISKANNSFGSVPHIAKVFSFPFNTSKIWQKLES